MTQRTQEVEVDLYQPVFAEDFIFAIKRPLQEKVQTILVAFVNVLPIVFVEAIYPVEARDFHHIAPASRFLDSNYLGAVLTAEAQTHRSVTKKESDALRRLKYVAEGGTGAFRIPDLDEDVWVILSLWPNWRRHRSKWKDRLADFQKRVKRSVSLSSLQKRCGRLGLSYSKPNSTAIPSSKIKKNFPVKRPSR